MTQFKKAQVILLPHNSINTSITKYLPNILSLNNDLLQPHTNQHLYIISDDEIKDVCWCYCTKNKSIYLYQGGLLKYEYKSYKKIIATTDKNLEKLCGCNKDCNAKLSNLPQPSQQFIEKYIEEYNKGNIITDVLVEYEIDNTLLITENYKHPYLYKYYKY